MFLVLRVHFLAANDIAAIVVSRSKRRSSRTSSLAMQYASPRFDGAIRATLYAGHLNVSGDWVARHTEADSAALEQLSDVSPNLTEVDSNNCSFFTAEAAPRKPYRCFGRSIRLKLRFDVAQIDFLIGISRCGLMTFA